MSATNHTTNYELPVFIGTDKPAWLVDWNSAMNAIDTAIKQAETKADTAGTDIGSIQSDIITINSSLTTLNGAVSQLRIDTNANTGAINTIQELIGNGTPTTTDHTIIGAINEINGKVCDFNLSTHGVATLSLDSGISGGTIRYSVINYLLNDDKSVGKVYGNINIENITSFTTGSDSKVKVGTLSGVTFDPVTTAYDILAGTCALTRTSSSEIASYLPIYIHVKTDGSLELYLDFGTASATITSFNKFFVILPANLYFLEDLGD